MVVFTCNACGESLKKAHVDKHVNMCRGCQVLSCIDCGKDFWDDEYKTHIKCISEDQKYGGKGYEAKPNKGEVKQQQWIQKVHDAMNKPGVNSKLKDVLKQVSAYDNIPRKKAKFENWMRNSLKISNSSLHKEVWEILNTATEDPANGPQKSEGGHETEAGAQEETSTNEKQDKEPEVKKKKLNKQERREARKQMNGKAQEDTGKTQELENEQPVKKKKKNRKRALECDEDGQEENGHCVDGERSSKKTKVDQNAEPVDKDVPEDSEDQTVPKGKFNWKGNIKAVLKASPDQELSIKKLRKKVLAAYYSFIGDCNFKTDEEVLALFNKKISSNPKFRVLKERVRLVN